MKRTVLLATAAVLSLAACSGGGAERDTSADPGLPAASSAAATESTAVAELNDRGHRVKALGEEGGFFGPNDVDGTGPLVLTFTVDSITVDPECTSGFANPPDNGHFIGIAMRVSTSPDYPPDYFTTFTAADFSVIGPDGLTVSDVQGQAAMCLGPNGFTYEPLGPGQQYAGTVVIDSPVTSGTLAYAPPYIDGGWEWQF